MVMFGVGEVCGGFGHGVLIDKIGSKAAVWVNMVIMIVMFTVSICCVHKDSFGWLSFAMCFLWGYQDGS